MTHWTDTDNPAYVSRTEDKSVIRERERRGILTGPDGRMSTNLPMPTAPPSPPPPADPPTDAPAEAEPGTHGFLKEPLKVGDWIKHSRVGLLRVKIIHAHKEPDDNLTCTDAQGKDNAITGAVFEGDTWERCAPPTHRTDEVTA